MLWTQAQLQLRFHSTEMKWFKTAFLGFSTATKIPGYTSEWAENQLKAWINCVHTILQNTTSNPDKQYKAGFEKLSDIFFKKK